jgi:Fic family protein
MYIWQSPQWPEFQVDLVALQPALTAARYAQGRAMGLASHLQLILETAVNQLPQGRLEV